MLLYRLNRWLSQTNHRRQARHILRSQEIRERNERLRQIRADLYQHGCGDGGKSS